MDSNDTSHTAKLQLQAVRYRLYQTRMAKLSGKMIPLVINTLITPVVSFAPLESKHDLEELNKVDKMIVQSTRIGSGLTRNDSPHMTFLTHQWCGVGIRSIVINYLSSLARELEVYLNDNDTPDISLRARFHALKIASPNQDL